MAYKTSPRTGKKRTKQQQAMYRRRRIVFGIATVLVLSFIVFCLYSLTQGVVAVNREIHHADVYAISRKEVPSPTQQQKSSVPRLRRIQRRAVAYSGRIELRCGRHDGLHRFREIQRFRQGWLSDRRRPQAGHGADDQVGQGRGLEIERMPRGHGLPADSQGRRGQADDHLAGRAFRSECADAADLPNVDRGVYSAQLSVKGHAKTKSEPVGITVE